MATKKNLQYYLNLHWSYTVERESDGKKMYYVVRINELPGVCTDAETVEKGMREIQDALKAALKLYLKHGDSIPVPIKKDSYKGKISYRTTSERHYNLAKIAKREHKSISKILDMLIDAGLDHLHLRSNQAMR